MAQCLVHWLPTIVPGTQPFSSDEIQGGDVWVRSLLDNLATAQYGILCVTSENRHAPWLSFEAGSLWKHLVDGKQLTAGVPVCPLLLDLEPNDLPGPLSLFQARLFDERGVGAVCGQLAKLTKLSESRLTANFKATWPLLSACVQVSLPSVSISTPKSGSQVPRRPKVEGWVKDPTAPVWVVVHPIASSGYWVQPAVSVHSKGHWKAGVYIGQLGTEDVGQLFEICAVACPAEELSEGMRLQGWPSAKWVSPVVQVERA